MLLVKNLITELSSDVNDVQLASSEAQMSEIKDLLSVLVLEYKASLNALDAKGRSLLTYSVEAGDRCLALTRFLINLGAKTFRYAFKMYYIDLFLFKILKWNPLRFSDQLGNEAASSAFAWFLRAQMRKSKGQNLDEDSLYVLGTAIKSEGHDLGFKAIVDRTMVALGSSREVHGPLFRRLRGLLAPYWLQPLQLQKLAVHSLRRSLGPKRLSTAGHELMLMSRLKVPRKLQRYITLEEKIPASKQ